MDDELPTYEASRQSSTLPPSQATSQPRPSISSSSSLSTVHESALTDSSGHKWLIICTSTRPRNPRSLPIVWEGDAITGSVQVDVRKGETAKSVTISLLGGSTFVGQDEVIFLRESKVLWTPPNGKSSAKLEGKHSWVFSFTFPQTVEVKNEPGRHRLPPTITQRASPVYIDYRLFVEIKRGALKVNKALQTTFGYHINTVAEPPSPLRRIAYSDGSGVLGPDLDLEGWKVLKPVHLQARLEGKVVDITIKLALPTPTQFAIAGPLPLHASFTSTSPPALSTLARPESIILELVRSIATGSDATDDKSTGRSNNYFTESEGFAMWWEVPVLDGSRDTRTFRGEVEIGAGVKPTFIFPSELQYSLCLFPPTGPEWVTEPSNTMMRAPKPLLTEPITIVSRNAPRVKPRSELPPGYDKENAVNYVKSVGLLENGNQRFLHTHR